MLQVLDPGLFTTVQDLGRYGFQQYGVTTGGAMDPLALRAANVLVGNAPDEAGLEITFTGPRLYALDKCLIAVTGARFDLTIDENPMPLDAALFVRAGSTIEFGTRHSGARAYLAIGGGIDVPLVLNSRSTDVRGHFGGIEGRALRVGDRLTPRLITFRHSRAGHMLSSRLAEYYRERSAIRIIWGPHDEYFDDGSRRVMVEPEFEVTELSDRMGLRLRGFPISRAAGELLSCGVTRGAIQVPADGQPIILMADHQTTGGYPIIATVIRADLPLLAQKIAGDTIAFTAVTHNEARQAY